MWVLCGSSPLFSPSSSSPALARVDPAFYGLVFLLPDFPVSLSAPNKNISLHAPAELSTKLGCNRKNTRVMAAAYTRVDLKEEQCDSFEQVR